MGIALSHLLNNIYAKPIASSIMATLIVLMAFQVAAPPRLAALDSEEIYEEFEEEDADPSERDAVVAGGIGEKSNRNPEAGS